MDGAARLTQRMPKPAESPNVFISRISLVDPAGKVAALAIAAGKAPGSLVAEGNADSLGPWILRWQVLSVDGHITRGEIRFLVIAKTAS